MSLDEYTSEEQEEIRKGLKEFNAYPVFIKKSTLENYCFYYDYVITPVFHNFVSYKRSAGVGNPDYMQAYRDVNLAFANEILSLSKTFPKALTLLNDPYFLLAPKMITQQDNIHIGYFFHTPFPGGEIYRVLPLAVEVKHNVIISSTWSRSYAVILSDFNYMNTRDISSLHVKGFWDCRLKQGN